ncbi:alanine racemase [Treponema sp. OttesenSCG-928-L16]|nr:alanine racemase [Treponema sp. OttesenSCG-928-L16]
MFLRFLKEKNPELIDYGAYLLEEGKIGPDTYILDLDAIESNARRLLRTAAEHNITLYFMAKQIGRNPLVSRRVLECAEDIRTGGAYSQASFAGMVAVDYREALSLHKAGLPVKHIGHLGQLPRHFIGKALDMRAEVITLYSLEKARDLSSRALDRGMVQDVLLRIWDEGDIFYQSQEGGFPLRGLEKTIEDLRPLKGIRVAGLTSFPCFLYDEQQRKALPTPNAETLRKGAGMLRAMGIVPEQINMPSCNSRRTIPLAAELGATHAEPGHSLTGTSPDNPFDPEPFTPALVYVSEISHHHGDTSCCYGGGFYRRSNMRRALIKDGPDYIEASVNPPPCEAIDYYFQIQGSYPVSSPVIMSFRTQIFVTRSAVALVDGISRSKPSLLGIWDSQGNPVSGAFI